MDFDVDELRLVDRAVSIFPGDPAEPIHQTTRTIHTIDPAVRIGRTAPWRPTALDDDLPFDPGGGPHVDVLQLRISSLVSAAPCRVATGGPDPAGASNQSGGANSPKQVAPDPDMRAKRQPGRDFISASVPAIAGTRPTAAS